MNINDVVRNIDVVIDSILVDNYKKLSREEFSLYLDSKIYFNEDELEYHIKLDKIKTELIQGRLKLTSKVVINVEEMIRELTTIQQNTINELNEYKKWI